MSGATNERGMRAMPIPSIAAARKAATGNARTPTTRKVAAKRA